MIKINNKDETATIELDKDGFRTLYGILISIPEQVSRMTWDDYSGNPDLTESKVEEFVDSFLEATRVELGLVAQAGAPKP